MNGSGSVVRAAVAGGMAGAIAALAMMALSIAVVVRLASRHLPAMMARMMREGGCSEQMRACMEMCGVGGAEKDAAEDH